MITRKKNLCKSRTLTTTYRSQLNNTQRRRRRVCRKEGSSTTVERDLERFLVSLLSSKLFDTQQLHTRRCVVSFCRLVTHQSCVIESRVSTMSAIRYARKREAIEEMENCVFAAFAIKILSEVLDGRVVLSRKKKCLAYSSRVTSTLFFSSLLVLHSVFSCLHSHFANVFFSLSFCVLLLDFHFVASVRSFFSVSRRRALMKSSAEEARTLATSNTLHTFYFESSKPILLQLKCEQRKFMENSSCEFRVHSRLASVECSWPAANFHWWSQKRGKSRGATSHTTHTRALV